MDKKENELPDLDYLKMYKVLFENEKVESKLYGAAGGIILDFIRKYIPKQLFKYYSLSGENTSLDFQKLETLRNN